MSAQDIGLAMVTLSLVFAGAELIRRRVKLMRSLFIPTAVIGGFLALILGPEVLGRLTDGEGIFSSTTFRVWEVTPGLVINVMAASLLLGKRLPPVKTIWNVSAPHVIMAGMASAGQYAVGGILVLLLLRPLFDTPPEAGALIEMSFAGGHGTLAGLSGVFGEHGV